MIVEFIAYHKLQAQAAESVFINLSKKYDCQWLMGPFNKNSKGTVGVLIDHMDFHDVKKSKFGYKYLFHLSHDIADVEIYKRENLHDFDIIFVPTIAHYKACINSGYKENRVKIVGWPKYDVISNQIKTKKALVDIKDPAHLTILYAPTFASNYEWKILFPFLSKIGCQVIVKNHIYVDNDQALPPGQEDEYLKALTSIDEMEANAADLGFTVVRRDENICNLFDQSDILLSDSSSCLIEFLPFGVSIATGGGPSLDSLEYLPEIALLSEDVWLCPVSKLKLIDPICFIHIIQAYSKGKKSHEFNLGSGATYGNEIAEKIAEYINNNKPVYPSIIKRCIDLLKGFKRRMGF
jgi:hypothetical protein